MALCDVHLLSGVGRVLGAVQHQGPLEQFALLGSVRVEDDDQFPGAARVLRPVVRRHERPFVEAVDAVGVLGTLAEDHRSAARGVNIRNTKAYSTVRA